MYLGKNKIYPLNNMHFSYQEPIIQLVYWKGYERHSFKLHCSVSLSLLHNVIQQRNLALDVSVKISKNGTGWKTKRLSSVNHSAKQFVIMIGILIKKFFKQR